MPTGPKMPRPIEVYTPPVESEPYQEYRDAFPRSEGPPPLKPYTGAKTVNATSRTYTLELDEGAFRAVCELLEATANQRWATRNSLPSVQAYLRAVTQFRSTYWAYNEKPTPRAVSPAPQAKKRRATPWAGKKPAA